MSMNKNIVLVVGAGSASVVNSVLDLQEVWKEKLKFYLMDSKESLSKVDPAVLDLFDEILEVNFDKPQTIVKALVPVQENLLVATCRSESKIPQFSKVIPHIPYLKTPTASSLVWSVDKLEMRRRFRAYDRTITPRYMYVKDAKKKTLDKIEDRVGFPLVVKPTGLAQSLLVSIAYHHEELEENLKKTFRKIRSLTKNYKGKEEPKVLVEHFIEGTMYSIDAYVNSKGLVYFCPMVSVKTGKEAGFDDFFGYQQMTPVKLRKSSIEGAQEVAEKAIHALGLRSTTAHVELIRTENGWKIIEVGPRVGGFRQNMYELSYGINHGVNDLLIRIPRKPKIPKKVLGYTAVFKIFPREPGIITTLTGVKKIQQLKSFYSLNVNNKVGDRANSASSGGKSVFNVTLFNEQRPKLLADIRRMEKLIKIETVSTKTKYKKVKRKKKKSR